MNWLKEPIARIRSLLNEGSPASLTYAALECRLAIELICYDRLRIAHDYISHDDIKKWQPSAVVNVLIQEVDSRATHPMTLFIGKNPAKLPSDDSATSNVGDEEFLKVGTQAGFDAKLLGKLWNALSNQALHIPVPESKSASLSFHGDQKKLRRKIEDALKEIERIAEGTLVSSGFGETISFHCWCGTENKRRLELLKDGKVFNCISKNCVESFQYHADTGRFGRRILDIHCTSCGQGIEVPRKEIDLLETTELYSFPCPKCGIGLGLRWKLTLGTTAESEPPKSPA